MGLDVQDAVGVGQDRGGGQGLPAGDLFLEEGAELRLELRGMLQDVEFVDDGEVDEVAEFRGGQFF